MDHRKFDRLTRVFAASGSRRAALRALLGAALLGATTRTAIAGPCDTGNNPQCTCGADTMCPAGKCFVADRAGNCPVCCIEPDYVICVVETTDPTTRKTRSQPTCCKALDKNGPILDPCGHCVQPTPQPGETCNTGITGSYRRR